MSISARNLRLFLEGGLDIHEAIEIAQASERGPNLGAIEVLIRAMLDQGDDAETVSRAALALARDILEQERLASERFKARLIWDRKDGRDSNRARRAMSDAKWRALRLQVFDRDDWVCTYCGSTDDLTCDHIHPLARGGTNDLDNLTTACRSCNSSKGDKLIEEWRAVA